MVFWLKFYFHITNIIKNPNKLMLGLAGKKQKRKRVKYTNYFPFLLNKYQSFLQLTYEYTFRRVIETI
jgi:hypothetical protein